ncbi:MAG: DUF6067 family protein, partial [Planctomycetota bacterium]
MLRSATFVLVLLACTPLFAGESSDLVVLDGRRSVWRTFVRWRRPIVRTEAGTLRALKLQRYFWMSAEDPKGKPIPPFPVERPPDEWKTGGFDDHDWSRGRCPVGPRYRDPRRYRAYMWAAGNPAQVGAICVRGRFKVTDPARVGGLRLRARYQGGVVAYVNGTEVGRGHMPEGEIELGTVAEPYPDEVYVGPDGELITGAPDRRTKPEQRRLYAPRKRQLDIDVPAKVLRRGVNVLAIEVHRAPYRDIYRTPPKEYKGTTYRHWPNPWPHCRLLGVELAAEPGSAVEANVGRPSGVQLWQPLPHETATGFSYGDPYEPLRPMRLVAMQNGAVSARVVVSSTEAIEGLNATAADLRRRGDEGTIAASSVVVRFALPDGHRLDRLVEEASAQVPVQMFRAGRRGPETRAAVRPVWFTVHVPADAEPGTYAGSVRVRARGLAPAEIPLRIQVHGWRLPDPSGLVTHNNLWQSHETNAYYYKVPLWSDRHFELMEQGLELTGPLANKLCMVPLICPSFCFGNEQSMVRWVPEGAGFRYDFKVFDRYLDLYARTLGKPAVMVIDVSHPIHSSRRPKDGSIVAKVSKLDPETGKIERMERRLKGEAELVAFWKPVLAEVKTRLEKRGWWDATRIGTASDSGPTLAEAKALKAIWPGRGWIFSGHPNTKSVGRGTAPVTCIEWVWGAGRIWKPGARRGAGSYPRPWKAGRVDLAFPRAGSGPCMLRQSYSLAAYRLNPEKTLQCGRQGIGRVGIDLWRFEGPDGRRRQLGVQGGQFTFNAGVAWLL